MLAQKACKVWQHHGVHLENNQAKKNSWTLADHPYLIDDKLELFKQLRSQILRLDTSVRERINKRVVAYSINTIFVDIVPQAKRLLLSLNLPYPTINDPEGWCKDVTTLGRWGIGDVEVGISSDGELEYIMSLIRQAYERQVAVET
jgi:predicted transport protein